MMMQAICLDLVHVVGRFRKNVNQSVKIKNTYGAYLLTQI